MMPVGQADEDARRATGWAGSGSGVLTIGALSRAARSGFCTAQFLGTASKNTKMTTISKTMPSSTPRPPKRWLGHQPDQRGRDQLADQDQQQDRD